MVVNAFETYNFGDWDFRFCYIPIGI